VIKNGKVSKKKSGAKVIPVRTSGKDNINNYQPIISKGKRKNKCLKRLKIYSKPFGVRVTKKGNLK